MSTKVKKCAIVIFFAILGVITNCIIVRMVAEDFKDDWIPILLYSVFLMIYNGVITQEIVDTIRKK